MSEEEIKIIYGDGVTDDTEAMQHYVNGGKCINSDGSPFPSGGERVVISETLIVNDKKPKCTACEAYTGFGPSHNGSKSCESGSIASGGNRAHCTCDTCF